MIYGHINELDQFSYLTHNKAWKEAFDWIQSLPGQPELGRHDLRGDDMFAMVMRYDTVPVAESRFETHCKYVDLQYSIEGAEIIGWAPRHSLEYDGEYDPATDLQFYLPQKTQSHVWKGPGHFSIYFPSDAHLPKLSDGQSNDVFKLVVKIATHLVI